MIELLGDVADGVVELLGDVVADVERVPRGHHSEVRAANVHAELLPVLLDVPLVVTNLRFGGALDRVDLAEGDERDLAAHAELQKRLKIRAETLVEDASWDLVVERGSTERREHPEGRARAPIRVRGVLRFVELRVHGGEARAGRPQDRVIALRQEQALLERVGPRLDRRERRRRQRRVPGGVVFCVGLPGLSGRLRGVVQGVVVFEVEIARARGTWRDGQDESRQKKP